MEKRKDYLDILRVLACFFVVWNHVNERVNYYEPGFTWILSAGIHTIVRPAVSVFAMISGATLLGYRKRYTTLEFFKRRITSVFIPFLIWSLLYLLLWICQGKEVSGVQDAIDGIFYYHTYNENLWFFSPLFGLYLTIPVFSAVVNKKRLYQYCIFGYILLGIIMPYLSTQIGLHVDGNLTFGMISNFAFYALVGYWIDQYEITKKLRIVIYCLGIICFVYRFICMIRHWHEQTGLLEIITAVTYFTWIRNIQPSKLEIVKNMIYPLHDITFGVYVIHRIVLMAARKILDQNSAWYITFGVIPVFLVCVLLCKMIKKIPLIGKTIR